MESSNQNNQTSKQNNPSPAVENVPLWQRPVMIFLGRFGDLVKGGGKTGANDDSDPQGTQKPGIG